MVITKDMKISDIVEKHPKSREAFLEAGIFCFGCGAAKFETLEQGLQLHGLSEKEIENFVKKLNKKK